MHKECVFVTLTYDEMRLPEDEKLQKRDVQLWLKRLRKRLAPGRFRYFCCGEYGERTGRPHYHAILFGVSVCMANAIRGAWDKGFVEVSEFNVKRARYVARYTVKKLSSVDGDKAEFRLMSRKPGLALGAIQEIMKSTWKQDFVFGGYRAMSDVDGNVIRRPVPTSVRIEGRRWALDRYLIGRFRKLVDVESDAAGLMALRHLAALAHDHDPGQKIVDGEARKTAEVRTRRDARPHGHL